MKTHERNHIRRQVRAQLSEHNPSRVCDMVLAQADFVAERARIALSCALGTAGFGLSYEALIRLVTKARKRGTLVLLPEWVALEVRRQMSASAVRQAKAARRSATVENNS